MPTHALSLSLQIQTISKNDITMNDLKHAFAEKLLGIKAIKLQPNTPFQWASGWNSPIYTDNRLVLSYPEVRAFVKTELTHAVIANFPEATAVAGVATGAIAMGMAVADLLQLPYAYVRPKPKDHGTKNQIEGRLPEGSKVVGMVASYTYGFPVAEQAFKDADLKLVTLGDYEHTIEIAAETGYVSKEDIEVLKEWRKDPANWKK